MADTVWARLVARADADPEGVAVLQKRFGLWTATTASALVARAARTAVALRDRGLRRDDVVALVLAPHEDRVVVDLALQLLGCQVVGIASGTPPPTLRHVLVDAAPRVAVVQGQAAADGLLALVDDGALGSLERMWYLDHAGVQDYASEVLAPFPEVPADGEAPSDLAAMVEAIDPAAQVARNYTSGTSGPPSPVVLSHANLLAAAEATVAAFGLDRGDRVLSFRPLSDPVERGATLFPALISGATLVLPESRASVTQAMLEVGPTYLHLTSRFVEELATDVRLRMQASRGIKKLVARSWNDRLGRVVEQGRSPRPSVVSRTLVGRPVLRKLGLDRARWVLVSGTPLAPEAVAFFAALGMDVRPAYSCAEAGGLVMASTDTATGSSATLDPLPGFEVDVVDDELRLRGPAIAAEAVGRDGWMHTGDRAEQVPGGTSVLGRVTDVVAAPGGRPVTAQQLAARLRSSPYIRDAVVTVEDGGVVAVVEGTAATLSRWATRRGLRYTTAQSLLELPEVRELLERAVDTAAGRLDVEVADVRVLAAPLTVAGGTLTATEKAVPRTVLAAEVVEPRLSPSQPTSSPSGAPAT